MAGEITILLNQWRDGDANAYQERAEQSIGLPSDFGVTSDS
jgi:hypothetical protein